MFCGSNSTRSPAPSVSFRVVLSPSPSPADTTSSSSLPSGSPPRSVDTSSEGPPGATDGSSSPPPPPSCSIPPSARSRAAASPPPSTVASSPNTCGVQGRSRDNRHTRRIEHRGRGRLISHVNSLQRCLGHPAPAVYANESLIFLDEISYCITSVYQWLQMQVLLAYVRVQYTTVQYSRQVSKSARQELKTTHPWMKSG